MYKQEHKLQDMESCSLAISRTGDGLSHVEVWQGTEYRGDTGQSPGKHDVWEKTERVFAFKSNRDKTDRVQYQCSVAWKVVAKGKE